MILRKAVYARCDTAMHLFCFETAYFLLCCSYESSTFPLSPLYSAKACAVQNHATLDQYIKILD